LSDEVLFPIKERSELYIFLDYCNESNQEKKILECGTGREVVSSIFYQNGYETYGIDISEETIQEAIEWCEKHNFKIHLQKGDMRNIPFENESFSFVFASGSIIFMNKIDIALSIKEMARVLKPNGLCFVNFNSADIIDEHEYNEKSKEIFGCDRASYHENNEADEYFDDFIILRKEKRNLEEFNGYFNDKIAVIDYIVKKK